MATGELTTTATTNEGGRADGASEAGGAALDEAGSSIAVCTSASIERSDDEETYQSRRWCSW